LSILTIGLSVLAALVVIWLVFVLVLLAVVPKQSLIKEALRIIPDVVRLVKRLATDQGLPWGLRWRLWLLLGYLALPIDLVPDFLPVIGYADDAIVVMLVLRMVVRRAGSEAIVRDWPGTPAGLTALQRLAGLTIN